jgi:hypothetical protein
LHPKTQLYLLAQRKTTRKSNRNYWSVINQVCTSSSCLTITYCIHKIIAVLPSTKENHKIKQELLKNSKQGRCSVVSRWSLIAHPNVAVSSSAQKSHDAQLKKLEGMSISMYHLLRLLLYFFPICSWEQCLVNDSGCEGTCYNNDTMPRKRSCQ